MQQSYGDWFIAITCKVILLKQLLLICFIYEKLKKKKKKKKGERGRSFQFLRQIFFRIFGIFSLGHRLITEALPFD